MKKKPKEGEKAGKGGYRPGSGRKPVLGAGGKIRSIWMDDQRWETIKRLVEGETMEHGRKKSISRWIIEAIDQRIEREEKD